MSCDVGEVTKIGEATEGLENELWHRLSEELVT